MNAYVALARAVRTQLGQDHRYEHSVRVARCAEVLAHAHGVDPRAARIAGMLHDLARLYSTSSLIEECERRAMPIDAFERENPIVLHARLGAALARERFGIEDERILSAIEKHTLGAATMSSLDCVIYLADSLEPGRDFPERAPLWALALQDLRGAMRAALKSSAGYLAKQGKLLAPQTAAAAKAFALEEEVGCRN